MKEVGYSGTPLIQKLGLRSGYRCLIFNPPSVFETFLITVPADITIEINTPSATYDLIIAFIQKSTTIESEWSLWKSHLQKNGALWIAHPKGSSKLPKDLNQNDIREFGLANGLVDTKVCAIDEDWSALKFMFRNSDR